MAAARRRSLLLCASSPSSWMTHDGTGPPPWATPPAFIGGLIRRVKEAVCSMQPEGNNEEGAGGEGSRRRAPPGTGALTASPLLLEWG